MSIWYIYIIIVHPRSYRRKTLDSIALIKNIHPQLSGLTGGIVLNIPGHGSSKGYADASGDGGIVEFTWLIVQADC